LQAQMPADSDLAGIAFQTGMFSFVQGYETVYFCLDGVACYRLSRHIEFTDGNRAESVKLLDRIRTVLTDRKRLI
jgi:hypothetical protein